MNELYAYQVSSTFTIMKRIFPNIANLISHVLQVAYNKQVSVEDVNITQVNTSDDGVCRSEICVNTTTSTFSTEMDVT